MAVVDHRSHLEVPTVQQPSYHGLTNTPALNIEFTYELNGFFFLKFVLSIGLTPCTLET